MKASWTNGLSEQEAKEVKDEFLASARLRDRLAILIRKKITEREKHGRSEDLYSLPNWELIQADHIGEIRAYEHLLSLIDRK